MIIVDVNILNRATEAFAKKVLGEQGETARVYLDRLAQFFAALGRCTMDCTLHTTEAVWKEYKPERNETWRTYPRNTPSSADLIARLEPFFKRWPITTDVVAETRKLRPVPKSERTIPESNDLTLLALALMRGAEDIPVIIATMDHALYGLTQSVATLGSIQWYGKTFRSKRIGYQTGLQCVEGTHRCCHIATSDFQIFQNHVLAHDMERMATIPDSGKKQAKIRDHLACINAMNESVAEKAKRRAALQGTA